MLDSFAILAVCVPYPEVWIGTSLSLPPLGGRCALCLSQKIPGLSVPYSATLVPVNIHRLDSWATQDQMRT